MVQTFYKKNLTLARIRTRISHGEAWSLSLGPREIFFRLLHSDTLVIRKDLL